jgi:hypothetical protein
VQRDVSRANGSSRAARNLTATLHGLVVAGVLEQDRELVAAQAGQQVPGAQVLAQPGTHLDQQLVPGVMAQAVVDLLELVQVQHQQGLALPRWFGQARAAPRRYRARRFGNPVSSSVAAASRRRSAIRARGERQLGAGRRRQQRHPGQGHSQCRHGHPGADEQHPSPARVATDETARDRTHGSPGAPCVRSRSLA